MRPALIARAHLAARASLWSSGSRIYHPSSLGWRAAPLGRTSPVGRRSTSSIRSAHIKLDQNEGILYVNSKFQLILSEYPLLLPTNNQTSSRITCSGFCGVHSVTYNLSRLSSNESTTPISRHQIQQSLQSVLYPAVLAWKSKKSFRGTKKEVHSSNMAESLI